MNCIKVLASKVYDKNFSSDLDKCRDTINFRNGIVCLKTGKFRKRTDKDYVSKILDYDYHLYPLSFSIFLVYTNPFF